MKHYFVDVHRFVEEIQAVHPYVDVPLLEQAYAFSQEAHHGQKRHSGEYYIHHPANVAYILATLRMDTPTIIAGLLHDTLEDTEVTYDLLKSTFNEEIANLVEGVTKLQHYEYKATLTRAEEQAENYRKLLFSISQDIRVIIIKLADRLHNMRTLEHLPAKKIRRIAKETLDIYAPLANRFGIAKIKWELEDLSIKYLYPQEYRTIVKLVNQKRDQRERYIQKVTQPIEQALHENGIEGKVYGRSKHFYSIFRKKMVREIPYDEIFDLAAIRILVATVDECYTSLGVINTLFEPVGRFRDYIARPKPNGYKSLHTIVIGPDGKRVEIQIRTYEMHAIAEEGIAAHWKYKEGEFDDSNISKKSLHESVEAQMQWVRDLLRKREDSTGSDFLEQLRLDLYPEIIITLTPNGDLIKLPHDATPIDFAFAVHTDVGMRCIGAKINGKMAPLKSTLKTGDTVEIFTANKPRPSKDWLKVLQTARARQKVRAYFRKKELEDAIQLGQEIFIKKCRKAHYKFDDETMILDILKSFKYGDINSFYADLGRGRILFEDFDAAKKEREAEHEIEEETEITFAELEERELEEAEEARQKVRGIKIEEIDSLMLRYARCCNPVPGDDIIGYTTRGRGLTIHRKNCRNPNFRRALKEEPERMIHVVWDFSSKAKRKSKFVTKIRVIGINRAYLPVEIFNQLAASGAEIQQTETKMRDETFLGTYTIAIDNKQQLKTVLHELLQIPGIQQAERLSKR